MLSTCRDGIKALDINGCPIQRNRKKRPAGDLKSAYYAKKRDLAAGNAMAKGMLTKIKQFHEATGQEQNAMPDDGSICEIRAAVAATVLDVFPGETVAAMLNDAHSSALFIKRAGVTETLAGSMQVPLDRALFLKDTKLLSDAEWQSMSATRGRVAGDNLQIYPTLHQVRNLRAALNADLKTRFQIKTVEDDGWSTGGRAVIPLRLLVSLLLFREVAENQGAPLDADRVYEFKLSADGAAMTKDGRGLLIFYLIPVFATWEGVVSHQSSKACFPVAIGMASESAASLSGYLGENISTVLETLNNEGVRLPTSFGNRTMVKVKIKFGADLSALLKLCKGIGSATANYACHLCRCFSKGDREELKLGEEYEEWNPPLTVLGLPVKQVVICSLHGNLRCTEHLLRLTFETITFMLLSSLGGAPSADAAKNYGRLSGAQPNRMPSTCLRCLESGGSHRYFCLPEL